MEKIGNAQKNSTRAIFFIGGFTAASWSPLVPVLRERLFIEEDLQKNCEGVTGDEKIF